MPVRPIVPLLAVAALALLPAAARAQGAEAKLREALRSTTAQLRTAEDDRTRLQASETALKQELTALRGELAAARRGPRAVSREVVELGRKLTDAERRLAEQAEAGRAGAAALARCQADGEEAGRAREAQQAEGKALRESLAAAEAKNGRLFQVGKEILDWLSSKGVAAALWAREPFLGLERVKLENAAEDFRDRLHEQRIVPEGRPR